MDDSSDEDGVRDVLEELSRPEVQRIQQAFDAVAFQSWAGRKKDEDQVEKAEREEGEGDDVEPGGFLVESEPSPSSSKPAPSRPTHIRLDQIPAALKILNLDNQSPAKLRQVFNIFEQAASSSSEDEDHDERDGQRPKRSSKSKKPKKVSRIQFLKVCAVLMVSSSCDTQEDQGDQDPDEEQPDAAESDQTFSPGSERRPSSRSAGQAGSNRRHLRKKGKKRETFEDDSSESSTDLSSPQARRNNRRSRTSAKRGRITSHSIDGGQDDDEHESELALDIFKMFLFAANHQKSHQSPSSLMDFDPSHKTIGFEEIKSVAQDLGEKLTDEEIQEMIHIGLTRDGHHNQLNRINFSNFKKILKDIQNI